MNSSLSPEEKSSITLSNIDTSDCGVIAIQAISGIPRSAAARLAIKHGYRPLHGTPRGGIDAALEELGFKLETILADGRDTAASFAVSHEYGKYIVYIEDHVMALIEGDLYNSRGYFHSHVEAIRKVIQ